MWDDINTGVFVIRPDRSTLAISIHYLHSIYTVSTVCREELLYLLNLKALGLVKVRQPVAGDQGWINEVYLWEKFNIGLQYNLRTGVVQVSTHQAPSYLLYPCIYLLSIYLRRCRV